MELGLIVVLWVIMGLVVFGLGLWFMNKFRTKRISPGEINSELAILTERLHNKEQQLEEARLLIKQKEEFIAGLQKENSQLGAEISRLTTKLQDEQKIAEEKLAVINEAKEQLINQFKALSSDALQNNNKSFLELAKATLAKFQESAKGDLEKRHQAIGAMVNPLKESLEKLEKIRIEDYTGLREQIKNLTDNELQLRKETANLVKALRVPNVRGRWGEIQLRRVVEMAGMVNYCDFVEQESVDTERGKLRPDMIIKLPNERIVVVDSKTPLSAYLEAIETNDENIKATKLKDHARQIKNHLSQLSSKQYWGQFPATPEFVVLFLPGEMFFSAALQQDPELIEFGVRNNIIVATPTTLIALLRAVAYGWKQEKITENALKISELGRELYDRIRVFAGHFSHLGKGLTDAIEAYNKTIGTLETRILVSARKFKELGVMSDSGKEITLLRPIDKTPRQIQADELKEKEDFKNKN